MAHRITILLDDASRGAARQLARQYRCSVSEAIRRAVLGQRDAALGLPRAIRHERRRTLLRLFELFDGNDAVEEVRRLKAEDAGF